MILIASPKCFQIKLKFSNLNKFLGIPDYRKTKLMRSYYVEYDSGNKTSGVYVEQTPDAPRDF